MKKLPTPKFSYTERPKTSTSEAGGQWKGGKHNRKWVDTQKLYSC